MLRRTKVRSVRFFYTVCLTFARTCSGGRQKACELSLEGIVSKRADAAYAPGKRGLWLKVKCLYREEFVVVGWTEPEGRRPYLGALLLAYYDPDGRLIYVGRVGTGIKQAELERLWRRLQPLATDADEPVPDYGALLGQDVRGLRIGVIRHFYTKDVAGNPEQVEALDAAVKLLAEAGAEVSEITLPALQDFSACGQIILAAEAYAVHEQWLKERPEDYGARARERLLAGATLRAVDYLQAVRWRLQLRDQVAAAFANLDAAITASSMDPACRIDDDEALAANYWRQARMPFNVTGQPGLVIPTGFSKGGLPLSLQLVGHPFGEAMLYRVAQFYEDATGWTKRHPPELSD